MRKATRYARTSALPAIAAALALSSTHALAQEAAPQPPPTASEPAPVSVDTTPAPEVSPPTIEEVTPAAPVVTSAPQTKATAKPKRTAAAAKAATQAPKPAPAATRAAADAVPAAPAGAPAPHEPASLSAVKPIVDTSAAPAQPAAPARPPSSDNGIAMELGGGALALLALGAGAYALSRRRRGEDEVMVEEAYEPEAAAEAEPAPMAQAAPVPRHDLIFEDQPAIVAPPASAFAWGNGQRCDQPSDDGSDRCPGETWVERAYRGPSPANPSVSLRNRLRRAAFFDKREREVAAGTAEPVETDAGLPDAMVEEQERELA